MAGQVRIKGAWTNTKMPLCEKRRTNKRHEFDASAFLSNEAYNKHALLLKLHVHLVVLEITPYFATMFRLMFVRLTEILEN